MKDFIKVGRKMKNICFMYLKITGKKNFWSASCAVSPIQLNTFDWAVTMICQDSYHKILQMLHTVFTRV